MTGIRTERKLWMITLAGLLGMITLTGCGAGKELSDDAVLVKQYQGLEIESAESEVEETEKSEQSDGTADEDLQTEKRNAALAALMGQIEVKSLPEEEIKEEYQYYIALWEEMAEAAGVELEEFVTATQEITLEEFEQELTAQAEDTVAMDHACSLIAEKEGLEPSEEEYSAAMEQYARDYGYDDLESFVEDVGEDIVRKEILQEIVADYILECSAG